MNINLSPVVKWVGGKRQLLASLIPLVPLYKSYCEPFLGGGALLFCLQPSTAFVNDNNIELINVYETIRDSVDSLLEHLSKYTNESEVFYRVRALDRDSKVYNSLSKVERAARILYLNKTCYNGLFRVNSSGEFNSPFGRYKNPNIVNEEGLRSVSYYLNNNDISINCGDYYSLLDRLDSNTFVYLDPPYDPVSTTSNFTGYTSSGFNREEQIRLREFCDELDREGIKFMLSNSSTDFIKEQYSSYNITVVKAKRSINSVSDKRGKIDEVVIRNYG